MLRTKTLLACLSLCALASPGCFRSPFLPPIGTAFTQIGGPIDLTFDGTERGEKVGRASSSNVLGLFAWGDASIAEAARNGRLTVVEHVDGKYTVVMFGMYSKYETQVLGK